MKRILIVVGTRPNFIKVTQFRRVAKDFPELNIKIVHTGQHFDKNMAEVFFEQFKLAPDYFLEINPKSPVNQMGEIMIKLEQLIDNTFYPDLIITPGDVNSTLAVAIVANKKAIKLAHLESGLRSRDRTMPEEINRILTDEISDYYFVTEKSGKINLEEENKPGEIFMVGNTMIDTLVAFEEEIDKSDVVEELGLTAEFVLMTIHRPSNVDHKEGLQKLIDLLQKVTQTMQVVFPIHPRTRKNIEKFGLSEAFAQIPNVILTEALGYFEFQHLVKKCMLVVTDSGGIQEETTFRQVPCLTLRDSTERPITTEIGSNTLTTFDVDAIMKMILKISEGEYKKGEVPPLWDGNSTKRILEVINNLPL
ncbi:MAG: UDP-N-acetylglucosamine 2-epimerase (non-hydrolyzing) [Crocinitomicaceae bacterium]